MEIVKICLFTVALSLFFTLIVGDDGFQDTLGHIKAQSSSEVQAAAANGVVQRLIPDKANLFQLSVDPDLGPVGKDTFQILKEEDSDNVTIVGTSGVAAAWGFHHYLKYYCFCQVSWDSDQLNLPSQLPAVNLTITSVERFRYYQNVCTFSYSFAWWDWKRWERELDWMALNGFNLALAFTGQEAIWQRVYLKLNLTQDDIDEHLSGPAFLAWLRMGNLRGFAGPLSDAWHAQTLALQHNILDRMRELGIVPVLPAFAGHVPRAFKRLFPDASMTLMADWFFPDEYCCPYLLEPTDPLFKTVGNLFLTELTAEFGTDHIYNCDTFNEMSPSTKNLTYLAQVSSSIFEAITDVDPTAVWMIQAWLFLNTGFWGEAEAEAFLTSVPLGRMLLLDLESELIPQYRKFNSFYGQPFIWCMLHDFGGTLGLYGALENVNQGVFDGRTLENGTMIGTGLTPEGINQNYVMYDLMTEMAWRTEPADLTEWFSLYAQRRYGGVNADAEKAWQLLKSGVYNCTIDIIMDGQFAITIRPSLDFVDTIWYNTTELSLAWNYLLNASAQFQRVENYQHDIVDVTRQILQVKGTELYNSLVAAYLGENITVFQESASQLKTLLSDLDFLLSSNKDFLLGRWLESAKALGTTDQEKKLYEYNARNQITLWGPNGEIHDYATKQWAGVVSHYYLPRWTLFLDALNTSLLEGVPFDQTNTTQRMFKEVEEPFTLDTSSFPASPQGDSVLIAKYIHARWKLNPEAETREHESSHHRGIPSLSVFNARSRSFNIFAPDLE